MGRLSELGDQQEACLSVKRGKWRSKTGTEPSDAEFQKVKPKVLARDDFACQECGIYSPVGMEVHHKDDIHENNVLTNLDTTCPLCHATHHIGFLGKNGLIVHLDELSQADVFNLLRTAAIAYEKGDSEQKAAATEIFNAIDACSEAVIKSWGSSSPTDFANAMMSLSDASYNDRQIIMAGLRLSVDRKVLSSGNFQHIASIQTEGGAYSSLPPGTWGLVTDKLLQTVEAQVKSDCGSALEKSGRPDWDEVEESDAS